MSFKINPRHITTNILEEKAFKTDPPNGSSPIRGWSKEEIVKYYGVDEGKIEATRNEVEWEELPEYFKEAMDRRNEL